MRLLPDSVQGVARELTRLGHEVAQISNGLQASVNQLPSNWSESSGYDVSTVLGTLNSVSVQLERLGQVLDFVVSLIVKADADSAVLFQLPAETSQTASELGGGDSLSGSAAANGATGASAQMGTDTSPSIDAMPIASSDQHSRDGVDAYATDVGMLQSEADDRRRALDALQQQRDALIAHTTTLVGLGIFLPAIASALAATQHRVAQAITLEINQLQGFAGSGEAGGSNRRGNKTLRATAAPPDEREPLPPDELAMPGAPLVFDAKDQAQAMHIAERMLALIPENRFADRETAARTLAALLLESRHHGETNPQHLAYMFATAHLESGMGYFDEEQIGEARANEAYNGILGNLLPGDGWRYRGRGWVQLTGHSNYAKFSDLIGMDLVNQPELAARPDVAAKILVQGMLGGKFTGVSLSHYDLANGGFDAYRARAIINGDRDHFRPGALQTIGTEFEGLYNQYLNALRQAVA